MYLRKIMNRKFIMEYHNHACVNQTKENREIEYRGIL